MGIPIGTDIIVWNAHREYGKIRYPLLIKKFNEIEWIGINKNKMINYDKVIGHSPYQPLIILKNNEFDTNQSVELSIFDITGKVLLKKTCNINDISTPANRLGSGMKIVTAKIGNSLIVRKLIVE